MNHPIPPSLSPWIALCAGLIGCSIPSRETGNGRTPAVSPSTVDQVDRPDLASGRMALPNRIVLPACYRLMLLEGQLTLVKETDEQVLNPAVTSLRIVTGEISRGELAYQPALLPQELAEEVQASRLSRARMDNALGRVMDQGRELAQEAQQLEAEAQRIGTGQKPQPEEKTTRKASDSPSN